MGNSISGSPVAKRSPSKFDIWTLGFVSLGLDFFWNMRRFFFSFDFTNFIKAIFTENVATGQITRDNLCPIVEIGTNRTAAHGKL